MNILVITDTLWPYGSGGELATYLYVKYLSQIDNLNVKILLRNYGNNKEWEPLSINVMQMIGKGKHVIINPFWYKKFKKFINWSDVVYMTDYFNLIPIIKKHKKPIVVHLHSYYPLCPIGPLYNFYYNSICTSSYYRKKCQKCILKYENTKRRKHQALASTVINYVVGRNYIYYLKYADAIVFVSEVQRTMFLKNLFWDNIPKTYVIYNPLPPYTYIPILGNDIGYFGGTDLIKGYHILLKAWLRMFIRNNIENKLHMTMAKNISKLYLKKGVITYGKLKGKLLEDIYRKIRGVIVPSIVPESSSYIVAESALRGRVIIASKIGGIPELWNLPGVRFITPGDIDELEEALTWILSLDMHDVIELGIQNRETVLQRYNNIRSIKQIIKIFNNLI